MKWLLIKNGVVRHALAPRDDVWMRHYRASKFLVVVAEDSERATEGWLYSDGLFVDPEQDKPAENESNTATDAPQSTPTE